MFDRNMKCPQCNGEFPLTWARYFKAPLGRFSCPFCGAKLIGKHVWFYWPLLVLGCCVLGVPLAYLVGSHFGEIGGIAGWCLGAMLGIPIDRYLEGRFSIIRVRIMTTAYRVGVVLHEDYGYKLARLLWRMPVWVVDTPINQKAAKKIWASHINRNRLRLTTFQVSADDAAKERCLGELSTIGEQAGSPPYSELEVFGLALTEDVRRGFIEAGFDKFEGTEDGFVAHIRQKV